MTAAQNLLGVIYDCPPEAVAEMMTLAREFEPEAGNSILMSLRWSTKSGVLIDLSSLTEQELDILKEFLLHGIELARPSVQQRDATAREAESNGDYRFARSNRPDPKMVVAPGKS